MTQTESIDTFQCNIIEKKSLVGRATGSVAKISCKTVTSMIGGWTIVPKLRDLIGINNLMKTERTEEETIYPIVEKSIGKLHEDKHVYEGFQDLETLLLNTKDFRVASYKNLYDFYHIFRNGEKTPLDIISSILTALKTPEIQNLGAVLEYQIEDAIKAAEESTQRFKDNNPLSIIDGVPFFVKEEFRIKGYVQTFGLKSDHDTVSDENTPFVKKFLDAGAILIGTTKMTYLGLSTLGVNPETNREVVRNPYNPEYYCGGSSMGSACLVSCGLVPFTISVDALGSNRIPPALTGVVGMRTTFGRTTHHDVGDPIMPSINFGPTTNNVRDMAILYAISAGKDENYPMGMDQPPIKLPYLSNEFDLSKFTFGYNDSFNKMCFEENILEKLETVIAYLKTLTTVEEIKLPEAFEIISATTLDVLTFITKFHQGRLDFKNLGSLKDANAAILLTVGQTIKENEKSQALKQKTRSIKIFKEIFGLVDFLITPAVGGLAKPILDGDEACGVVDDITSNRYVRYSAFGAFTGIPSIVVNVGVSKDNLPIGIQISSAWWSEEVLLDVAYVIEKTFSSADRKPKVFIQSF